MAARTVPVREWDPDGTVRLLSAILWKLPSLTGAACQGRHELFDELTGRHPDRAAAERERLAAAVRVCRGCPARPACPESLFRRPGETKIPIAGYELVGGRFPQDHR